MFSNQHVFAEDFINSYPPNAIFNMDESGFQWKSKIVTMISFKKAIRKTQNKIYNHISGVFTLSMGNYCPPPMIIVGGLKNITYSMSKLAEQSGFPVFVIEIGSMTKNYL